MRFKSEILLTMTLSILVLSLTMVPMVSSQVEVYGPVTSRLHIEIYMDPYSEFEALGAGIIDITDWPMSKFWVDRFAKVPEEVTLRDYAEIGMFEYDINLQRWPTGVAGSTIVTEPAVDTDLWRAWQFRRALAYLTDKDYIRTEILKGYANTMDTPVAVPALIGWLDMENLTASGLIDPYRKQDVAGAEAILDAAGFTMITTGPDAGKRQDPRKPAGEALDPLIFYIRLDDPNRRAAGEKLAADMNAIGIPTDARVVEKTVCFKSVMVVYDFHLYTGGWSLGPDPEWMYDLFSSDMYWGPDVGWSVNYNGFRSDEYDSWALKVKNPRNDTEALEGVHKTTYLHAKYVGSIPLWCSAGVQGYRTGWAGVVNHDGYGPSAPITGGGDVWSFLTMEWTGPERTGVYNDTIWWGWKSSAEAFHVISSEWVWDYNVIDRVYDGLLARNPYFLPEKVPRIAKEWSYYEWEPGKIALNFTLRDTLGHEPKFGDGTLVKAEDIAFSMEFVRDCGPGVAWGYPSLADLDRVEYDNTAGTATAFFNVYSLWAVHWAGFAPILNKDLWMDANAELGWGYVWPHGSGEFWDWDQMAVREYHPWEDKIAGDPDVIDMQEDGCGAWKYVGADALLSEWVELEARRDFYMSQTEVSTLLEGAFHDVGDVNKDRVVDISDMSAIAKALGTDDTWPHGTGWNQYNEDADLNGDGKVDATDLGMAGRSYGKSAG